MKFYGIQKTSLLDYPGQIACTLFTFGCNFRCPYCHNPELVIDEKKQLTEITGSAAFSFLRNRRRVLDGLVITGGEPLLHAKELKVFLKKAHDLGYLIKVDTNGTFPEAIEDLNDTGIVDYWAMDVKFGKDQYEISGATEKDFEKIRTSIEMIRKSGLEYEFRTTAVPGLHDRKEMREIGELIEGAERYAIQNFTPNGTIDPSYGKLRGFNERMLEAFAKIARKFAKHVEIRD